MSDCGARSAEQASAMSEWTADYFDRAYLRRWNLGAPTDEQRAEASSVVALLGAGATLLDVGCGQGRYSVAFADLGLDVVGCDPSSVLLDAARRLSDRVRWVR